MNVQAILQSPIFWSVMSPVIWQYAMFVVASPFAVLFAIGHHLGRRQALQDVTVAKVAAE